MQAAMLQLSPHDRNWIQGGQLHQIHLEKAAEYVQRISFMPKLFKIGRKSNSSSIGFATANNKRPPRPIVIGFTLVPMSNHHDLLPASAHRIQQATACTNCAKLAPMYGNINKLVTYT